MTTTIVRRNKLGQEFTITGGDESCTVSHNGQSMEIGEGVEAVNQRWYDWITAGLSIQIAFMAWSADHRKFIMTGTTPDKWEEMFPQEDDKR